MVALRAAALGADLHRPHRVVAVRGLAGVTADEIAGAVAAAAPGRRPARRPARRAGRAAREPAPAAPTGSLNRLHDAITQHLGIAGCGVGIGLGCEGPADFPRSWEQAQRALAIRCRS